MIAGALVVTRTTGPLVTGFEMLDVVALLMGLSALAISILIRQRLPGASGRSVEEWWREHQGRAMLIWIFLEMPAVIGAITLMVTRRLPVFLGLGVVAMAGLVRARPGRLYP